MTKYYANDCYFDNVYVIRHMQDDRILEVSANVYKKIVKKSKYKTIETLLALQELGHEKLSIDSNLVIDMEKDIAVSETSCNALLHLYDFIESLNQKKECLVVKSKDNCDYLIWGSTNNIPLLVRVNNSTEKLLIMDIFESINNLSINNITKINLDSAREEDIDTIKETILAYIDNITIPDISNIFVENPFGKLCKQFINETDDTIASWLIQVNTSELDDIRLDILIELAIKKSMQLLHREGLFDFIVNIIKLCKKRYKE